MIIKTFPFFLYEKKNINNKVVPSNHRDKNTILGIYSFSEIQICYGNESVKYLFILLNYFYLYQFKLLICCWVIEAINKLYNSVHWVSLAMFT